MQPGGGSFYDELEREAKIVVRTSHILERKEEDYQFKEAVEHSIPQNHEKLRRRERFHELDVKALIKMQKQIDEAFKAKCEVRDDILYFKSRMVIPKKFFVRVLVKNHVLMGHPSKSAETKELAKYYFHGVDNHTYNLLFLSFRGRCLHCQRGPRLIRRPLHLTKLGTRARRVLGADYLFINSNGYILAIVDTCTRKVQLTFSKTPTAKGMAEGLERWRDSFGFESEFVIVTDNGSHFSNMLLQQLTKSIGFEQYFAVAYSPWTNGETEVINATILKYLRSLLSQYAMHESE
eukprot:snap_masked-scaffold_9-processed-gene-13.44-mRNA-1 protein AED:0.63 eAED:0.63 QI:0/0/0/0.5/1/1/2/0/291